MSNMCTQHEIGVLWYWRLKQEGWSVLEIFFLAKANFSLNASTEFG